MLLSIPPPSPNSVVNLGRSSMRDHCSYTRAMGAFTTTNCWAAFIAGHVPGAGFTASVEFSNREPCILIPREGAVPSAGEVKQSHVEHEHRVVTPRRTPENPPRTQL